jgi:hypothetical protein
VVSGKMSRRRTNHQMAALAVAFDCFGPKLMSVAGERVDIDISIPHRPEAAVAGFVAAAVTIVIS